MLPDNTLSTAPVISPMLYPKNLDIVGVESFDLGGIGLNDPSQGLQYQAWHAWSDIEDETGTVFLGPIGQTVPYIQLPGVTQVSITFDQNMNPFLAFVQNGVAKFRWWDTVTSSYQVTDLPVGSTFPRASLDDKRQFSLGSSDIILAYIRDSNLYYRQQRDRYENEYLLYPDLNLYITAPRLHDVGMGTNLRFQFMVQGAFFPV